VRDLTPWGDADTLRDRRLPPGRSGDRDAARRDQRERLFAALVASCDDKGYDATSVEDLLRTSGVSRATFYEQFDDKLACFRAAMLLRGIIGGLYQVIYGRLRERREAELPDLVPGLWEWTMSFPPPPRPLRRPGRLIVSRPIPTAPPFASHSAEQRIIRGFASPSPSRATRRRRSPTSPPPPRSRRRPSTPGR
jgi:AcrR family transcriptional regulator